MPIIACFDSNIVGWAIRGDATSGQEDNILKAKALFKTCQEEKIKILIPAIAFGEVLCPISLEQQKDFGLVMMKEYPNVLWSLPNYGEKKATVKTRKLAGK